MRLRDELVRAAVWAACDARDCGDHAAFVAACAEIVRLHRLAPLVEYARAIEVAEKIAADVALMRSTYVVDREAEVPCAA